MCQKMKNTSQFIKENIISIGGMGGSGTRVVAEILLKIGVFMGDELNDSNDNLVFTRLFKNPSWYKKSSNKARQKRMNLFYDYMSLNKLSIFYKIEMLVAYKTNPLIAPPADLYKRVFSRTFNRNNNILNWGWKEPNTQFYALELLTKFKHLKYIHVIRHGLDMAFSNNTQQLKNWGWKYNININGLETKQDLAVKQLEFWIKSTKEMIEVSKKFKNRILFLDYTYLCKDPSFMVNKLVEFMEISVSTNIIESLLSIPKNIGIHNKFQEYDISFFPSNQISEVKKLGYQI